MWIELTDNRLLNLDKIYDIHLKNKRYIVFYYDGIDNAFTTEEFDTPAQAQARYEEIKGMLIGESNIEKKLNILIDDISYWAKEITNRY